MKSRIALRRVGKVLGPEAFASESKLFAKEALAAFQQHRFCHSAVGCGVLDAPGRRATDAPVGTAGDAEDNLGDETFSGGGIHRLDHSIDTTMQTLRCRGRSQAVGKRAFPSQVDLGRAHCPDASIRLGVASDAVARLSLAIDVPRHFAEAVDAPVDEIRGCHPPLRCHNPGTLLVYTCC